MQAPCQAEKPVKSAWSMEIRGRRAPKQSARLRRRAATDHGRQKDGNMLSVVKSLSHALPIRWRSPGTWLPQTDAQNPRLDSGGLARSGFASHRVVKAGKRPEQGQDAPDRRARIDASRRYGAFSAASPQCGQYRTAWKCGPSCSGAGPGPESGSIHACGETCR